MLIFWGLPPLAAGPLQGSQGCSALRASPLVCRCAAPLQAPRPAAASPPASCRDLAMVGSAAQPQTK